MKSKKMLLSLAIGSMLCAGLTGCGGSKKSIIVWVGEESAKFYQTVCNEYLAAHEDFGFDIQVKGMNTGTVAGTITSDASSCADIFTVAHDNIGKIVEKTCVKPILSPTLLDQVEADNSESFKKVCHVKTGSGENEHNYLYGVPYISQALILYYNKELVSEEQAKTIEGLTEAATNAGGNTKALTVTGDDGYNFSFSILARKESDKSTSVKIYEGAEGTGKGESNIQGDDQVAIARYMQDSCASEHGFKFPSSDGWQADFKNKAVCAFVGGSWNYDAAANIGASNLGMTVLPTLTLTASNVEGLSGVSAGDVYRGGTFADCKVFMINNYSDADKYAKEQELITYLSSKDLQNRSFIEAKNVPAYTGAAANFKTYLDEGKIDRNTYACACAQSDMNAWGIPQPFVTGLLNTYYYSKSAPSVYRAIVEKKEYSITKDLKIDTSTFEGVRQGLFLMEFIWMKGQNPGSLPTTFPAKNYNDFKA